MRISDNFYPNLMFLLLTKRPSNINKYIPEIWKTNPPENVMFGTSPVNQETSNKLIPQLLQVKGKHFLSIEPQLGPVDLTLVKQTVSNGYFGDCLQSYHIPQSEKHIPYPIIDWVIQGGESGHHRRTFNLDWGYDLKRQCNEAGTPYFFKQIDKVLPIPEDLLVREFPVFNL